ncbi:MAG TPA: metallophosphoesterase [Candidatus Nanoarchaeia archaeon]|nr:metallophosphoesterase [Candidatus Nanoarchaeia archaeon]
MEISPGITIIGPALFIQREKLLVINDLHLGYEQALHQQGVLAPRFQLQEIATQLEKIIKTVKPKKMVINGDLKHEFGRISSGEWRDVLKFMDVFLPQVEEIIIIKGNHDPIIKPIAEKRGIQVVSEYRRGDILIAHGDEIVKTTAKRIVIGHEHPAITIREGSKWEKYKCFLKGTWKRKELIVVPSFNPLLEGSDILQEKLLSPFLKDISAFSVYVVSKGEAFGFGKVKEMRKK